MGVTHSVAEDANAFVGRERELRELAGVLDRASTGRGELVLVAGTAGMGKTALVEEFVQRPRGRFDVAWANCWEGDATPAFWPWFQLLPSLTGGSQSAGVGAGRRSAPSSGDLPHPLGAEVTRLQMFDSVVAALRAHARGPQILVIDDLHAADPASLELLSFVASSLRSLPVVVVATYRFEDVDANHPLGQRLPDLLRSGRQQVLSGLKADEVAGLAAAVSGVPPSDGAVAAITQRTGGNPLFVRELVRLLQAKGSVEDILRPAGTTLVPESVRALLGRQVDGLPVECRHLLEVASVVGIEFEIEVLAEAAGTDLGETVARIDQVITAHVVQGRRPGRCAFAHGLFRDAVYEALGEARRAALHQRAGEALERLRDRGRRVEPTELAHHFVVASALGHWEKAAIYSGQAGDQAIRSLAYEDAVCHYERMLEMVDRMPGHEGARGEALLGLADAAAACGDRTLSRRVCLDAVQLGRASGSPALLAGAALRMTSDAAGFEVTLFDREQIEILREALAALGHDPSALRALVMARLSVATSLAATVDERRGMAEQAVAVARASADQRALAYALAAHCDTIAGPADVERRLTEAEEIVALAVACQDRRLQLLGQRLRLVAHLEAGDVLAANAAIESYSKLAAELRQPLYGWFVPLWRGLRALMNGEIGECERWLDEATAIGSRAQSTNAALLCAVQRWVLLTETGRGIDALAALQKALGSITEPGTVQRVALALGLAAAGSLDDARAHLDAISIRDLESVPQDSEWLPMLGELSEAIAIVGGHPLAPWVSEALHPHRNRFMVEGIGAAMLGSVEHPLGQLAALTGRRDDAADHFAAALAAHRRIGAALLAARTLRAAGAQLGDPAMSKEAVAAYEQLGLEPPAGPIVPRLAPLVREPEAGTDNRVQRHGEYWTVAYAGRVARVRGMKGLNDIARLLDQPGREMHVLDLTASATPSSTAASARHWRGAGSTGDVIDSQAREAYRNRLIDLDREIQEADEFADLERAEQARAERDALVSQLASAYGLGGRARRSGDPAERARSTVTRRIHDALRRLETHHPELGLHLRRSIRTGTFCVYEPDQPIHWTI